MGAGVAEQDMNIFRTAGIFLVLSVIIALMLSCIKKGDADMARLRESMVKRQIEARGVTDERVLSAMRTVPRDRFVPGHYLSMAYEDHPLPIGHGQTISQPYIVALMSELCDLNGTEKVLEIGTGSGYQAAVLSFLAKDVYSIELVDALGAAAKNRLSKMGYDNVHLRIGDGYKGWPEEAPFDVVILTAAPPEIPDELINQLKDGGVLVAPVGEELQELVKIRKTGSKITRETITYVRFVPMVRGN